MQRVLFCDVLLWLYFSSWWMCVICVPISFRVAWDQSYDRIWTRPDWYGKIDWHVIEKKNFHEVCYMQYNRRLKILVIIMKQSKYIIFEFCTEEWFCNWVHMYVIYTACLSQARVLSPCLCVLYLTLHGLSGSIIFAKEKTHIAWKTVLNGRSQP